MYREIFTMLQVPFIFFIHEYEVRLSGLDAMICLDVKIPEQFIIFIFQNILQLVLMLFVYITEPTSFALFYVYTYS